MEFIVYTIVNTANGQRYVGSSFKKKKRFISHRAALNKQRHSSKLLQEAYNNDGKDKFEYFILEEAEGDRKFRNERETFWIRLLKSHINGYNLVDNSTNKGIIFKKETREKQSIARKESFKNGIATQPNPKGQKRDAVLMNTINFKKRIPVTQYSLNNNFIKKWDSATEAGKMLNINTGSIYNCISKTYRTKSAGGFIWKKT